MSCSAIENKAITDVWAMIGDYHHQSLEKGTFQTKRSGQSRDWMHKLIHEMLEFSLKQNKRVAAELPQLESEVVKGTVTPYGAARQLISYLGSV
jgi:LAO/AO transport system kinase